MFSDLNEKQKEAAFSSDGPLLIVAGAGSGKTKTLTARLAYLIGMQHVDPSHILAITFTNKAADEMKRRAYAALEAERIVVEGSPFIGTFHAFGAWFLRKEARHFGRAASFTIFDGDDSLRLIKRILKDRNLDKTKTPAFFDREIGRIKSELLEREYYDNASDAVVWEIYEEYERALIKNNAFDFDDLIEKPVRLLRTDTHILEKYQHMFSHVLVDEYQDTNTAQYMLIKLLAQKHRNLTVVGDDAQAIYRFRFSDYRNFLNFERDWKDARVVFLEQNYRSTKHIIESSSGLIERNIHQKKKRLWTDNEEGASVRIIETDNEFTQADIVVQEARAYVDQGRDVAILYRTNAQSRALEQLLLEYGLPYLVYGAVGFYERKEIKDILAAVKYGYNPQDSMSYERLEKALGKRVTKSLASELVKLAGELSPADFIQAFMEAASFKEIIKKEYANYADRMENVSELIYFAQQFGDFSSFIEKISLVDGLDKTNRSRSDIHIRLMTIHLAKGLEFDAVFIVGANEGLLPHQRSLFSSDDLEEERRLMYVAMTRARKELYILFYQYPSRFITELPTEHLYFIGDRSLDDEERYIELD